MMYVGCNTGALSKRFLTKCIMMVYAFGYMLQNNKGGGIIFKVLVQSVCRKLAVCITFRKICKNFVSIKYGNWKKKKIVLCLAVS